MKLDELLDVLWHETKVHLLDNNLVPPRAHYTDEPVLIDDVRGFGCDELEVSCVEPVGDALFVWVERKER